jgi:hypothetical protein
LRILFLQELFLDLASQTDYFAATLKEAPLLFSLMKMLRFRKMTRLVSLSCGFLVFVVFAQNALGKENHRKHVPKRTLDPNTSSDTDKQLFEETQKYLGTRYKRGGDTKAGIDCSGFVKLIYRKVFDVDLPRNASEQYDASNLEKVSLASLRTGDLIFFSSGRKKKAVAHVGIYLADGEFIHAATRKGVTISSLGNPYWKARVFAAKRMIGYGTLPVDDFQPSITGLSYAFDERNMFSLLFSDASLSRFSLRGMDYAYGDNALESYRGIALGYALGIMDNAWSVQVVSFRDYYFPAQSSLFPDPGLKMDAFDPASGPSYSFLKAPHVEGIKVASPIQPSEWLTINPSIIYFASTYGMESRDLPKLALGLDFVLASAVDRWSFSTGFQYPLRDPFDTGLAGLPYDQGYDLSLTYRQWLSKRTQLSIEGANRTKLYLKPQSSSGPFQREDPKFSLMLHFFY